jgi:hypothetical protein
MQKKIYLNPETNAVVFCFLWHTNSRCHVHEDNLTENLQNYIMFKITFNYGILKVSGSKS